MIWEGVVLDKTANRFWKRALALSKSTNHHLLSLYNRTQPLWILPPTIETHLLAPDT